MVSVSILFLTQEATRKKEEERRDRPKTEGVVAEDDHNNGEFDQEDGVMSEIVS